MSETAAEQARARDFERFLTFIDAIVAIAVTLLVLPLVDVVGRLENNEPVTELLGDNKAAIGAFLLSFAVIANLWLTQHRMLRHVIAANERLTRLLMLWTVTIVFLPFPTALVAGPQGAGGQAVTQLLYVGTMTLSSFLLGLVCVVLSRHPELRESQESPDALRAFATAAAFAVALAVMLLVPPVSYWPLLLLLVSDRFVGLWRRRRQRAHQQPQV
jgi:uncharacterized membrane protein